ncbi:MAG: HU family DNA-binding protein [bacterium]
MNKAELLDAIAKKTGESRASTERGLNAAVEAITKELKKGKSVQLVGFGTFSVKNRAARTGVNPATGQKIKIKAKKVAVFKAGAKLKGAV